MGKKMEETYVRRWRNDDLDLICVLWEWEEILENRVWEFEFEWMKWKEGWNAREERERKRELFVCVFVTLENGMVGVGYVSVGLTTCGCTKSWFLTFYLFLFIFLPFS
jgi:hypothetical protein